MFFSKLNPDSAAAEHPAVDLREADEKADEIGPVTGALPAPAGRFGITDLQRWLDLCG